MSNPTSFSSIIIGRGLITTSGSNGNNLYINNQKIASSSGSSMVIDIDGFSNQLRTNRYYGDSFVANLPVLTWGGLNQKMYDNGNENTSYPNNTISIDWSRRGLYTDNGLLTLDWSTDSSLYATNCSLMYPNGESASLQWRTAKLIDETGYVSILWKDRVLYPTGTNDRVNMDWSKTQGIQMACVHGTGAFVPVENNMFTVQVNETTNKLNFVVKYSNGVAKSGSMNLS